MDTVLRKRKLFYVHFKGESGAQRRLTQGTVKVMLLKEGARVSGGCWCPKRNKCPEERVSSQVCLRGARHGVSIAACPRNGRTGCPQVPWPTWAPWASERVLLRGHEKCSYNSPSLLGLNTEHNAPAPTQDRGTAAASQ